MTNQLGFEIYECFGTAGVLPQIDGQPLSALVGEFEQTLGWNTSLSYGGLIPDWFSYGSLDRYFMGNPDDPSYWTELSGFYLLGCKGCGDVGCWPIVCSIAADDVVVTWKDFRQPHRPTWDYSGFGPFTFDRAAYERCVKQLARDLAGMADA